MLWVHWGVSMMGERSAEEWQGGVGTRKVFPLNFDSGDGSVLRVYRGVRMMRERSTRGWHGGVEGKSKEV